MKKFLSSLTLVIVCFMGLVGCYDSASDDAPSGIKNFYNIVCETKELMDIVADDYYSYWYDAIYKDKYSGNINIAIAAAGLANEDNINKIKENDVAIASLYKNVKNGEHDDLIKEVMFTYSDYYEFVIEVSGSFKSYSSNKETKKKALATALKNLSYEI